jgi:putative transposase
MRGLQSDVHVLCSFARVSRSGYYKWLLQADERDRDYPDFLRIKQVFDKSKRKFGWRTIKMRLPDMNHKKIQRIMRKYGLVAKVRRKNPYRAMHKKTIEHRVFPNALQRAFKQNQPLMVFCTDITYLHFLQGFAYLSVVKDIASGEVVAWNVSLHMDMLLVTKTIQSMPPALHEHALVHSDQGFHYSNPLFITIVKEMKMNQSMSAKGCCIDNAPIESFFGHMKDELEYQSCRSIEELRLRIGEYMQYYNYERKQWNRNKMTPVEYRDYLLSQVGG